MTKQNLISRAQTQLADIRQYFADVREHNSHAETYERFDPDPDGTVRQLAHSLERFIHINATVIDV